MDSWVWCKHHPEHPQLLSCRSAISEISAGMASTSAGRSTFEEYQRPSAWPWSWWSRYGTSRYWNQKRINFYDVFICVCVCVFIYLPIANVPCVPDVSLFLPHVIANKLIMFIVNAADLQAPLEQCFASFGSCNLSGETMRDWCQLGAGIAKRCSRFEKCITMYGRRLHLDGKECFSFGMKKDWTPRPGRGF